MASNKKPAGSGKAFVKKEKVAQKIKIGKSSDLDLDWGGEKQIAVQFSVFSRDSQGGMVIHRPFGDVPPELDKQLDWCTCTTFEWQQLRSREIDPEAGGRLSEAKRILTEKVAQKMTEYSISEGVVFIEPYRAVKEEHKVQKGGGIPRGLAFFVIRNQIAKLQETLGTKKPKETPDLPYLLEHGIEDLLICGTKISISKFMAHDAQFRARCSDSGNIQKILKSFPASEFRTQMGAVNRYDQTALPALRGVSPEHVADRFLKIVIAALKKEPSKDPEDKTRPFKADASKVDVATLNWGDVPSDE
jgi:hypothetical protein